MTPYGLMKALTGIEDDTSKAIEKNVPKEVMDTAIVKDGKIANDQNMADILPTEGGFFFGSKEYDQWYIDETERTYYALRDLLSEGAELYYYHSSW